MENLIGSIVSGFGHGIAKLFGPQLDFLSGKSCSSLCGPTWDFPCYVENFCIAHLLKLAAVSFLFYIVLLFFYLIYKLGICQCICGSLCKMSWACVATIFSVWEYGCYYMCHKLRMVKRKRKRHKRDVEMLDLSSTTSEDIDDERNFEYHKEPYRKRLRDHKRDHLRRSLRPRSHRVHVGLDRGSMGGAKWHGHDHPSGSVGSIRVTQTSRFARRGTKHKRSKHLQRRR